LLYAIYRTTEAAAAASSAFAVTAPAAAGASSDRRCLKFGDRYLVCARDTAEAQAAAPRTGLALESANSLANADLGSLHLVTQQGRLFQLRYPGVPVLLDAGRHLVVSISRQIAGEIAASATSSFSIAPVTGDEEVFAVCPCPSPRPQPDPAILRLVGRLSRLAVKADITTLATFPTRHSVTRHYHDAADWAAGRFEALGYGVTRWGFTMTEDKRSPAGRSLNVVAQKAGTGSGERALVIVSAHLDSINEMAAKGEIDRAPAPGADDNASGSAGALEMARVFSDVETTHDLRFILFGGEEQGMIGSDRYAKELTIKDRKRIVAVVNMDMIAVDNEEKNPPAVLLEGGPVSRSQIAGLCLAAHTYTTLAVNTTLKPWNSDHVSFLKQGIAAVLTIEGYDKSNRTVHTPSDTLDHIDYDLALQIVRMNTAFVATMAGISAAGMT
jgi:hypothetical protein